MKFDWHVMIKEAFIDRLENRRAAFLAIRDRVSMDLSIEQDEIVACLRLLPTSPEHNIEGLAADMLDPPATLLMTLRLNSLTGCLDIVEEAACLEILGARD